MNDHPNGEEGHYFESLWSTMFDVYINLRHRLMITKPPIHYLHIHSYRWISAEITLWFPNLRPMTMAITIAMKMTMTLVLTVAVAKSTITIVE